ncbi:MAG TPA: SDR family oxidoreductase [Planctomycetaceae bacterium]|nr:SDR family oxidoreductase [Planctomycetaceae bacterium]
MLDSYADRWALITGASSGIGMEFARRLAALGMHLVLTARRESEMKQLADELDTRHGTRCEIIPLDLSVAENVGILDNRIRELDIEIELLVNNAGFGLVGTFEETDPDRVMEMVRLNIGTLTELSYRLARPMVERKHGAIINVASVAAFQPVAYMGAYAASKSYVMHFSEALWAELKDHGVTVMALCPGVTKTSFFDVAGVPEWLKSQSSHTPAHVVKTALKHLEKRRQYVVCGWKNYILSLMTRLATRKIVVSESRKYFRPKPKKNKKKNGEEES